MDEGQKRAESYYLPLLIAFRLSQFYCMNKTNCICIYDAPQAITGDRVNRECYMQVRVHNSHLGACFCVARL